MRFSRVIVRRLSLRITRILRRVKRRGRPTDTGEETRGGGRIGTETATGE